MKVSDIHLAKRKKFKLCYSDAPTIFLNGALIRITETQKENEFLVSQYGANVSQANARAVLCRVDSLTAEYLREVNEIEKAGSYRYLYAIDRVNDDSVEVQTYSFNSVTAYKTPIFIQVPDALLEKTTIEKLYKQYVWDELGEPALFCLNYKSKKKQNADLRFLSGKRFLFAHNTPRGIIAVRENYLKNGYDVPVDVFVAPEIKFVPESESSYANESLAKDLDRVSNPASYFARWEAYNELSKKLLDQESEEFGELKYISYIPQRDLTGITFEFTLSEDLDESFVGTELGAGEFDDSVTETKGRGRKPRQTPVGSIKRISGKKIITYLESADGFDPIPDTGCLSMYTAGDRFIMARREVAKTRMVKHESPIKHIVALIEAGASEFELPSAWGSSKAITEKLVDDFPKAKNLNPQQEEALRIAINTPDIALIQGPPGTGKTTVIKAICARFREIYEANERQYQKLNPEHHLRSPKILISSFQNEAVDNAISAPLAGDIPAYRKTAKRAKGSTKEQYQRSLDKWYAGVTESVNQLIESKTAAHYVETRKSLSDAFLSYKNAGESLELAAQLIQRYLAFDEIQYPQALVDEALAIIKVAMSFNVEDDLPDPIVERLEAQRTTMEAFADDGRRNAKRLVSHLKFRDDLDLDEDVIQAIQAVCEPEYTDADFVRYAETIEGLRKRFCSQGVVVNAKDKNVINRCLLALSECFSNQYINTLSDFEGKKSLILSEFLSRLEQDYESLVKKYSMTTAATCQTCLDLRDDANRVYDLVVIDEAARANPLDLFIPMSMGKKVILVGDHKQLPHMLEPDVLKVILSDPKFNGLPEIEKSLFERLFSMFSKGQTPKAVLLTDQFRMHPDICAFVSDVFYDGQLRTSPKVAIESKASPKEINNGQALTFVNIPIARGAETPGASKSRRVEAEAICADVKHILSVDPSASVGIITFYAAQVTIIRQMLDMSLNNEQLSHVEVGTVDAFQGKEFDYVLLSCVRSNRPKGDNELPAVGFLTKPNRLCVAFSRSIRQLAVYGDAETLSQIPCFLKLYEICACEGGGYYREY